MDDFIKEACVENLEQAIHAEKMGADRIELCADLHLDGLTPSKELILKVKDSLKIPCRVMVRPRGGDFIYSGAELAKMETTINFCKEAGVEGVVFGVLNKEKNLDLNVISKLAAFARPLKVVIHKAIDDTLNPVQALQELIHVEGIDTVLTSGGAKTAMEGKDVLLEMIKISNQNIELMPAGKITSQNVQNLHAILGARAYHGKRIV